MPYCPKCGNKVEETMAFCPKCGTPAKRLQPQVSAAHLKLAERAESQETATETRERRT